MSTPQYDSTRPAVVVRGSSAALKVFPVAAVYGRQIALLTVVASLTAVFALLLVPFIRIATCEAQQVCTHCDCSLQCPPSD